MAEAPATKRLTLSIDKRGAYPTVRCSGRLVAGVSDLLYSEVKQLLPGSQRVVLDFAELTHMDSTGIGTLVRLYVSAKSSACTLEVINMGKPIRQLLGVTHLLEVFETIAKHNIRIG
jgi:anti-sigma B factor antagonist